MWSMRIKGGVRAHGVMPETVLGMMVAESVYRDNGYKFVVTAIIEGGHSRASLHYIGAAFDCRINNMPASKWKGVADEIRARLGGDYDVVLEDTHIHVEWQPKEPY
jgi:uncharacterized protein YcbK (DUF882 family)